MKGQKGITLVALIITIIVMLILVAVTISVALNGGLFDNARKARRETKIAQVKEAMALAKAEILSDYYANTDNASSVTQQEPTIDNSNPSKTDPADVQYLVNKYLDSDFTVTFSHSNGTKTYTLVSSTDGDVDNWIKNDDGETVASDLVITFDVTWRT